MRKRGSARAWRDRARDEHAARIGDALQADRDDHAIAVDLVAVDHDLAVVDPDAERDAAAGRDGGVAASPSPAGSRPRPPTAAGASANSTSTPSPISRTMRPPWRVTVGSSSSVSSALTRAWVRPRRRPSAGRSRRRRRRGSRRGAGRPTRRSWRLPVPHATVPWLPDPAQSDNCSEHASFPYWLSSTNHPQPPSRAGARCAA